VAQVIADGMRVVEPSSGWLSCRRQGTGRMAEPDQIAAAIEAVLATMPPQPAS
jgi:phosphopantothenoylcysteine synthetase/decarboxylase